MSGREIQFFNRQLNKIEIEKIYGDAAIKFIYDSPAGKLISGLAASKVITKLYGSYQDLGISGSKVPAFVKKFNINLAEYKPGSIKADKKELSYKTFNEFFIREFIDGQRHFTTQENAMPAFCEARYFGHESLSNEIQLPVKGKFLKSKDLLPNSKWSETFKEGPFLIARLCPVDYHRYHYPADGKTLDSFNIPGEFHSVNPIALKAKEDILIVNERRASILETEKFGKLAYIEVGASMVGKIVQSFDESQSFKLGDEKGYFLFGGSTVIVLGEKGKWKPSADILKHTKDGIETYLKLGEEVATK